MSDAPKGGKQAPKVAKKGEKRAGKKGGKIDLYHVQSFCLLSM